MAAFSSFFMSSRKLVIDVPLMGIHYIAMP